MFFEDDELSIFSQIVNILIDSLLWMDLFINMLTTYEVEDNNGLEISRKKVIFKYIKSWFFVDFIAAFPY